MGGESLYLPPFIFYDYFQGCVVWHLANQQPLFKDKSSFARLEVPAMQMCIQSFGIRIIGKISAVRLRFSEQGITD
jgi:hypothetical protein